VYYQPNQQRLYCPCHEGVFSPETGDPIAGPPQRRLEHITLQQDGDVLYAADIQP
jgi:Rieske Fe-S protein